MADLLLVHGSCHGAWCWRDVIPELCALGHDVRAIDMPGHGSNALPAKHVTLDAYARGIAAACAEGTMLVGHSLGGYAITAAAAVAPQQVSRLIYLCAYVPAPDLTLSQMRKKAPRQPLLQALRKSDDGLCFTIEPDKIRALFYHDCPDEAVDFARQNLCPQPIAPSETTVEISPALRAIPRRYIRCMDDRTIPPEFQITMTQDWPAHHVLDMNCSHSPFFADPKGLATSIDRLTKG